MKSKDAMRYRWLRDNSIDWPREVYDLMEKICTKEEWDGTIDEAMKYDWRFGAVDDSASGPKECAEAIKALKKGVNDSNL